MERRAVLVRGIVQGVGFRPFVYKLAEQLHLGGFVRNQTGTVVIEVEGDPPSLDHFLKELSERPPPLACIEHLSWSSQAPQGQQHFQIEASDADGQSPVFISPDVATCAECLAEMFSPEDRRSGYPFLNCTHCGPRLTIITGAPYDRARTTMASFPMCQACRAEYDDPHDRRFHAQPTACAQCGPRLQLLDTAGRVVLTDEPLATFAAALSAGKIGALKGLGGYHLACDARNSLAARELRRRKHRDEKPFAVMVPDETTAGELGEVGPAEVKLLRSPARPIVLLRKRPALLADEVAPGNPCLGVMLPYTPLHHLLLRQTGIPLVMTSGNRSDEPIVHRDDDLHRLHGIADLFLVHDRPIHVRCDDSVARIVAGTEQMVRRSRGYAPRSINLPIPCPQPMLAVGGQLKATFALGRDGQAFLSHHLGDLDHFEAYQAFERDIGLYEQLFRVTPEVLVHDLHPDYASTRYVHDRAARTGARMIGTQHHHAHMASCMAEHGLTTAVIGVTFDGTGFGLDGTVWGGEFLVGDYRRFRRAAHLRVVGVPGGDAAIREPWRMALAHLIDAEANCPSLRRRISAPEMQTVERMLERRFNTPLTSSMGRLFDAVASLAGIRDRVSYEGQAAIELEWLATSVMPDGAYPFEVIETEQASVIDTRPLIRAVAEDTAKGLTAAVIARRFQSTVVEMVAGICHRERQRTGLATVVLSGGTFMNVLLTREVSDRLRGEGFQVYHQSRVPPNDGGLSLGQLAIAAARLAAGEI